MASRPKSENPSSPRPNERLVLSCLRHAGSASKPDLARQVALTPQAVHGIVDGLIDAGLVEVGGRRGGAVGYPSTLYSIKADGAYAIGIEVGARKLEAVLVNFTGQMIYRGQVADAELTTENIDRAVTSAVQLTFAYARGAGIDLSRILGAGVINTSRRIRYEAERPLSPDLLRSEGIELPVHVEREAVAGALAMAIVSTIRPPASYFFISIGSSVDGCVILNGSLVGAHARPANHLSSVPISATRTLGDIVGFDPLARRLGSTADLSGSTETFFRETQANPAVFDTWLDDSAEALATVIATAHALNDLGGVFLRIAPPNSVGDLIVDRISRTLRDRVPADVASLPVHRQHAPVGSSAMCAATMVLANRYGLRYGPAVGATPHQ